MPRSECFQYFRSIINKDGEIEEDVNYRITSWWMEWRSLSDVLYKGKFYKIAMRLTML
jgi:hypothetical protein